MILLCKLHRNGIIRIAENIKTTAREYIKNKKFKNRATTE